MTKIIATSTNCWQAFLACMLDEDLKTLDSLSSEHEDWQKRTAHYLAARGLFYVETAPLACTALPDGALVGADIANEESRRAHIVIAKVIRHGDQQAFEIFHDPSRRIKEGIMLNPATIVLLCTLTQ